MTPNDVLAKLVETWWTDDLLSRLEAGQLADALEDAGRGAEGSLLRSAGARVAVNCDLHDRWYLMRLDKMPKGMREQALKVEVEGDV